VTQKRARESDTFTYIGTIDDVVLRYPWSGIPIGADFLNDTIIDHVLFGTPMLINDGYLINHPLARADLMKGEESLLAGLIESEFIKVLTRVSNPNELSRMPAEMARQNISSFAERMSGEDSGRLISTLDELGDKLLFHRNCYRWPSVDMGDGFRLLVENCVASVEQKGFQSLGLNVEYADQTIRMLSRVAERLAKDTSGARTHFEDAVIETAKTLPNDRSEPYVNELMGLANEIYHFNFGIQLDSKYREDGLAIVAETRLSRAFDDMLAVDERVLEIDGELPLMGRPDLVRTLSPKALAKVVDPQTEIGKRKLAFQKFMRAFSRGEYTLEEAADFAHQYEKALADHFVGSEPMGGRALAINVSMTLSAALVGVGLPSVSEGAWDLAEGIAYGTGLGVLASQVGEPNLMRVAKRFRNQRMLREFENSRVRLSPHMTRALLSSVRFQPETTDPIAAKVKRF